MTLLPHPEVVEEFTGADKAIAIARIGNHYMANHGWLEEGQLLQGGQAQGHPRRDRPGAARLLHPPIAAWQLKKAWPEVELNIVPDGGHLYNEPGVLDGLIRATDKFADR